MSRDQIQTLWGKLAALLEDILQELPPERWQGGGEEGMDVETTADPVSLDWIDLFCCCCFYRTTSVNSPYFSSICFLLETRHGCRARGGVCRCDVPRGPARRSLLHRPSADCSQAAWSVEEVSHEVILLWPVSDVFHPLPDVLLALPVSESPLQLQILTLCELWWKKDLQEKEKFALTALLVALKKCFSLKKMVSVSVQHPIDLLLFFSSLIYVFTIRLPRSKGFGIFTMSC